MTNLVIPNDTSFNQINGKNGIMVQWYNRVNGLII